jgi:hypothetical protein
LLKISGIAFSNQVKKFITELWDYWEYAESGEDFAVRAMQCPREPIAYEPPSQTKLIVFEDNFVRAACGCPS